MSKILSVGTAVPPNQVKQEKVQDLVYQLFHESYPKVERLLNVFNNGGIKSRYFAKPLEWYGEDHSFEEKNNAFIEAAIELGCEAIIDCLEQSKVDYTEIDAIFTICTTGLATPSIEARIMNRLPFKSTTKRIPIWGLGCAGGAAGLARAHDYCKAYPDQQVLVLGIELCSLTFQREDVSKSNIVGTSLFADGVACVLVAGEESRSARQASAARPIIEKTQTTLMEDSLDVMGWEIRNEGLFVVFSKDIPTIVNNWVEPNVKEFLRSNDLTIKELEHFIAHPGGKKVIDAYEKGLGFSKEKTKYSKSVLERFGNMSSVTVLFVLKEFLQTHIEPGDRGLLTALGPGFSSELLLLRWG
ncbi:MAG TPA: 3-oxoacyl-[acyl-carrier-protein] synthase III C-terminal domain-containing protein [Chondromyces sp.]|nr:3-oxoacyl-[acyl-carrier-protein] synthase III C-terminal domain-containing protein [Chondromyces sp.]